MNQPQSHILKLAENRSLGGGLFLLRLTAPEGLAASFAFHAGQFAEVSTAGHCLPRPFSILSASEKELGLLVKQVGAGTRQLCELLPGSELRVTWPLGNHFELQKHEAEILLVGGGVGVAPLLAACAELQTLGRSCKAIFGFRSAVEVEAVRPLLLPACDTTFCTEDGSAGCKGFVTHALSQQISALKEETLVLSCGPDAMMRAVASMCHKASMRCLLSLETFMGCGVGICAGCAVKMRGKDEWALCCQQGPVFDAAGLEEYA